MSSRRTPAQITRENFGFVLYISSFILLALYFLWALLPLSFYQLLVQKDKEIGSLEWIFGAILSAIPSREVTLYFPAIVVWIVCTYGSIYALLSLVTTPSLDELCTLYDAYSKPFKHLQRQNLNEVLYELETQTIYNVNKVHNETKNNNKTTYRSSGTGAANVLSMLLQEDETIRQQTTARLNEEERSVLRSDRSDQTRTQGIIYEKENKSNNLKKYNTVRMPTPEVADLPITLVNRVMFGTYLKR